MYIIYIFILKFYNLFINIIISSIVITNHELKDFSGLHKMFTIIFAEEYIGFRSKHIFSKKYIMQTGSSENICLELRKSYL